MQLIFLAQCPREDNVLGQGKKRNWSTDYLKYLCQYTVLYSAEIGFPESEFWVSQGENADKNKKGRKHSPSTLPH